jgi:hypothetical protein
MEDDQLWDMSDEALEAAFKEASAQSASPDTDIEAEQSSVTEEAADSGNSDEAEVEEVEEEVLDGSDQPEVLLEESDHDASDEDEVDEVDEDNTAETDEDNPDGDAETEEEESSEETEETTDAEQPTRSYSFRANGKDYEFSSDEIVDQFPKIFGKAMDYTKKMQTIKPWRKTIDAIEGAKISHDDVSLMIDVLKGDKDAITEVLKRTGTDTLELNTEEDSGYKAKDYGRDESALAISDIVDEISKDAEYATTHNILSKDWDERSWEAISQKPEMIKLLHTDVKSGMYDTLQPIAEKLKMYDGAGKPDLEYYKEAAQQHFDKTAKQKAYTDRQAVEQQKAAETKEVSEQKQSRVTAAKAQSDKRVATKQASAKRKAAAPTKSASADRVVDYLDESDENFDDWYSKLQNSL